MLYFLCGIIHVLGSVLSIIDVVKCFRIKPAELVVAQGCAVCGTSQHTSNCQVLNFAGPVKSSRSGV